MKTWHNGKIIEGRVAIDSLNFGLHYGGPNAWEGIRSYKQQDGTTKIFKLKDHVDRLFDSAKFLGFEIPYSKKEITQACVDIVKANGEGDLYLRPIAYTTQHAEPIREKPQQDINVDIYCFTTQGLGKKKKMKVSVSNLIRGYPHYEMQAKTSHNYHFLQESKLEADRKGVDEVLLMDHQGYITESPVSNIFIIKGDVIMTPPNDGSILPGITRRVLAVEIIQNPGIMLRQHKTPVIIEKKITKYDVYTADAVVLCGTYAEIIEVVEVDGRLLPGSPYIKILSEEYQKIVRNAKDN